jgi:NAD+ kinase
VTAVRHLIDAGTQVVLQVGDLAQFPADDRRMHRLAELPGVHVADAARAASQADLVLVLGGDGTILRAAEAARPSGTPLMGINLGHVGFLAEAEVDDLRAALDAVVEGSYDVEERMALDVQVLRDGVALSTSWALNEVSVEKAARERMLELIVEVDGRPLSRWGCDGVVMATPTGSTAYAFSCGGPIVWPEVEALLMVPISAHALFARPVVTAPTSVLAAELVVPSSRAVVWCDGRRPVDAPPGTRVEVRRAEVPVRLARLHRRAFTDRLVRKLGLSVEGWRGTRAHVLAAHDRAADLRP